MKALLATLAVLGATAFSAVGPNDPNPTQETGQELPTIEIEILRDGESIRAEPDSVYALPGQMVTWNCEFGEWMVFFKDGQPFGEAAVGEGIRGGQGQRSGQAVRTNAAHGEYKYDIMVRIPGEGTIRIDPEVVVGPGDGPGN